MILVDTIAAVRERCDDARRQGRKVGLVPTMGYLHSGHRSLMAAACAENDFVVVSVFVNPLQFGPTEDLAAYPRDLDRDRAMADDVGVDVVFVPSVEEMYPCPPVTTVTVAELTDALCGASRPGHFPGVATVVTKLFSIVGPCAAYFGKKDFQQLIVIKRLVEDLSIPVTVVGCPTVREPDGVAMSSRNAYLDRDERQAARVLVRSLDQAIAAVRSGERDARALRRVVADTIEAEPRAAMDYAEVVRAADLRPVEKIEPEVEMLVAVAARIGPARLIDNCTFTIPARAGEPAFDLQGFASRTSEPHGVQLP